MRSVLRICIVLLFLCSCGDTKNSNTKSIEEKLTKKEVVEITIAAIGESMSEIAFAPSSVSVPENSVVKLVFKNNSSAPGMLHNFVLVQLGSGNEISSKGLRAGKSKDFVPNDDRVFANTKILDMGEMVSIEFDAPPKGSYHYICTFPGHTNMVGRLNVQ